MRLRTELVCPADWHGAQGGSDCSRRQTVFGSVHHPIWGATLCDSVGAKALRSSIRQHEVRFKKHVGWVRIT